MAPCLIHELGTSGECQHKIIVIFTAYAPAAGMISLPAVQASISGEVIKVGLEPHLVTQEGRKIGCASLRG